MQIIGATSGVSPSLRLSLGNLAPLTSRSIRRGYSSSKVLINAVTVQVGHRTISGHLSAGLAVQGKTESRAAATAESEHSSFRFHEVNFPGVSISACFASQLTRRKPRFAQNVIDGDFGMIERREFPLNPDARHLGIL